MPVAGVVLSSYTTLRLKLLCNCHFFNFSGFSKMDCHILFTVTGQEIVMRAILLKNIIL